MKRELSLIQNGTEQERQKSQRISSHNPCSYFKPYTPYPVFLFLFKFLFKFPNFPLEALDVLGELGNSLGLLATTTAAPRRTSGPAVITGRERIIKTNGLPVNTAVATNHASWITTEVQRAVHFLMSLPWHLLINGGLWSVSPGTLTYNVRILAQEMLGGDQSKIKKRQPYGRIIFNRVHEPHLPKFPGKI